MVRKSRFVPVTISKLDNMVWKERLEYAIRAQNAGKLSRKEIVLLRGRAYDWEVCAVGENKKRLKKRGVVFGDTTRAPLDKELEELGVWFAQEVDDCQFEDALNTLERIERFRSAAKETT